MGLEEIRLAAELGVAGVLGLTERMPRIVTAPPCWKFDRIALAEPSAAFCSVRVAFDDVFAVHEHRRMARQADRSRLGAPDSRVEEHRMRSWHTDSFLCPVLPFAEKIQVTTAEVVAAAAKRRFAIRRVLLVDFGDLVER